MASIQLQGDNSGSLTIQAPSDAGNHTLTLPATSQTLATQNALGVRNLIINGDMRIAQRGTSRVYSGTYNCIDRWAMGNYQAAGHEQVSVSDPALTAKTAIRVTSSSTTENAGGTRMTLGQMIESVNCSHLAGKTATLSFWVRFSSSSFPGSVGWSYQFSEYDTVDPDLRTTGATRSNATSIPNGSFPTEWTQYTKTITCGTNMKNLGARFENSNLINTTNNSDAWYEITQVQIEAGDTATPFEHRPYDMELARCQRYFCSSFLQGVAPANGVVNAVNSNFGAYDNTTGWSPWISFPVTMRTAPSMTAYRSGSGVTDGQWTTYDSGYTSLTSTTLTSNGTTSGFYCNGSRSSAFAAHDTYLLTGNFTADAEL